MIRITAAVAVLLGIVLGDAQAQTVDYSKSQISFTGKQMGVPADGQFRKFTAQIAFESKQLAASKVEVSVDLNSIDTGSSESDIEVKTKNWFNVPLFPAAKFSSTSIKQTGPDKYEANGKLSIKGISQDLRAPFTAKTANGVTTFDGGFTILRLGYKVGEGPWGDTETVANEVQVKFHIVITAK
ncbi:MAG: YceI family protein [Betaproteobacteria bacterium]